MGAGDTMRFLKLTLSYDGTGFFGWQSQPGRPTIQGEIEKALRQITGEATSAVASGRTDAGVHALGQAVSVRTHSPMPCDILQRALAANLPDNIGVIEVRDAPEGFHAIRDAISKRYRYVIDDGDVGDVFVRRYAWRIPRRLDDLAMHESAQALLGKHDFSSFEAAGAERQSSVRTIGDIFVARRAEQGGERVVFEVEADGFLYHMVRNIVGVLVKVGRGREDVRWPAAVLAAKSRLAAANTAPARGLFLVSVRYST
jgi:tRNA pseudouridine38-40 synthase